MPYKNGKVDMKAYGGLLDSKRKALAKKKMLSLLVLLFRVPISSIRRVRWVSSLLRFTRELASSNYPCSINIFASVPCCPYCDWY
jgi:hypothetical protein